jgi:glycosyltransferase involved in cell wall biosynthesis
MFLNLCLGLDRLGVTYRVNDYRYARRHPNDLACIIGKPFVLGRVPWTNPILFGAAVYSHPLDDPELLTRLAVRKIVVPGPWMEAMCRPYWGNDSVKTWPVGIDTDRWQPMQPKGKVIDVLIYDKVRWEHNQYEACLIEPIRKRLRKCGCSFEEIRYGYYREEDFLFALSRCRSMIFLCEHETQGIAYQQALSCGVPVLAWDRAGPWKDPAYYPHRIVFEPVTSVPYWDRRCGAKFVSADDFQASWEVFWDAVEADAYAPRDYILENLTLEKCAREYLNIVAEVGAG